MLSITQERSKVKLTKARLDKIEEVLKTYYKTRGWLPGPAKMNTRENTADFGVAVEYATSHSSNDEWTEVDGSSSSGNATDKVRIGVVPTRTLGLQDEYMYDAWGNRITYAVIKELTSNRNKFAGYTTALTTGVIKINDKNNHQINPANAKNPVAYALVSHGKDGIGAINSVGQIKRTCASPSDGMNNLDQSNCDKTHSLFVYSPQIVDNIGKKSPTQSHYYDFVRWRQKAEFDVMETLFKPKKCPLEHWSYVPAGLLPDNTAVPAFCIMTFEAKKHSSKTTPSGRDLYESRPDDSPAGSMTYGEARQFCNDLDGHYSASGYKLITESQWLSVAGQIINLDENWSTGSVGSGKVKIGAVYSGAESGVSYVGTNQSGTAAGDRQLSKLRISTDSKIAEEEQYVWDLSGNSWEFTQCDFGSLCITSSGMLYPNVNNTDSYFGSLSSADQSYSSSVTSALRPVAGSSILTTQAGRFRDRRRNLDEVSVAVGGGGACPCISRDSSCSGIQCCDQWGYAGNNLHCSNASKAGKLTAHHIIVRGGNGIFSADTDGMGLAKKTCWGSYPGGWSGNIPTAHVNHDRRLSYVGFRCTGPTN